MVLAKRVAALVISTGLLLGMTLPAAAQPFDELLSQVTSYKLGQSRKPLETIQDQVIKGATDPAKRAEMARKLAALLSDTNATFECKDFVCRQLYIIGTAAEVPAVAKLLADQKLSHMARYVLERMEDPAAGAALRDALAGSTGNLLIGVVNSIGNRRDAQAVPALKTMLGGQDKELACAAAAALGKIGGPESLAAITAAKSSATGQLKDAVIDSYIRCADELLAAGKNQQAGAIYAELYIDQPARIRMAALRGMVAADPGKTVPVLLALLRSNEPADQAVAAGYVARQMPGQEITNRFAGALSGLSASAKVLLIDALGARGDAAAKPTILTMAGQEDETIRIAAIKAIGFLGSATEVPMLAGAAAKGGRAGDAARESLSRLRGPDVDEAVESLAKTAQTEVCVELIKASAARGASSAVPTLLDLSANAASDSVRSAALTALGALASEKDYGTLVQRVLSAKTDGERDAARAALASVASRMNDKNAGAEPVIAALPNASGQAKIALLGTLSRIGGDKALAAVRTSLKDADAAVQEASMRAMTEWSDAGAITDLMDIAKTGAEKQKILALRGLVRLISKADAKAPPTQVLTLYKQMLDACTRPEEKRLVVSGLADVKNAGALDLLSPLLSEQSLRNEAATAMLKVAKSVGATRAPVKAALQKIVDSEVDPAIKKQSQDLLAR